MKFFIVIFLGVFFIHNAHAIKKVKTYSLVDAMTSTGAGTAISPTGDKKTFHLTGSCATGTGEAEVYVQVSNDGTNYINIDTLTLSLSTAVASDYYVNVDPWKYVRGYVSTLTATTAPEVTLTIGTDE